MGASIGASANSVEDRSYKSMVHGDSKSWDIRAMANDALVLDRFVRVIFVSTFFFLPFCTSSSSSSSSAFFFRYVLSILFAVR